MAAPPAGFVPFKLQIYYWHGNRRRQMYFPVMNHNDDAGDIYDDIERRLHLRPDPLCYGHGEVVPGTPIRHYGFRPWARLYFDHPRVPERRGRPVGLYGFHDLRPVRPTISRSAQILTSF